MRRHPLAAGLLVVLAWITLVTCHHSTEPPTPAPVDSTSHTVVWRTDTIGIGGFTTIRDISVIDQNDIWAAGEIYMRDSLGRLDSTMYNALHWDGIRWSPLRLAVLFNESYILAQSNAVIAFSHDDVWLVCGGAPEHWDGSELRAVDLTGLAPGQRVRRMWGATSTDFYLAGTPGKLSRRNGSSFTNIPTDVISQFCDITGRGNEVFISSYVYGNQILPSGLFRYDGTQLSFVGPDPSDTSDFRALANAFGIWMSPSGTLWALGESYVFRPLISHERIPGINPGKSILRGIRGSADNDVWIAGEDGIVLHYNGATWRQYHPAELGTPPGYIQYNAVSVKGNIVAIGGWTMNPDQAIVTIGRRAH
jgi:hypothetical protein